MKENFTLFEPSTYRHIQRIKRWIIDINVSSLLLKEMFLLLKELKQETNYTLTNNGALTHKSTMSNLVDYYGMAGALRNRDEKEIIKMFLKAFNEDNLLAMKLLFYTRGIRGCGLGERRTFRILINYMAKNHTDVIRKNLELIPLFGRWDDLFSLIDTPLQSDVVKIIEEQLKYDLKNETCSLLAKWMPSENASSCKTKKLAHKFIKLLGVTPRNYKKTLTTLRKKIGILETKITNRDYDLINYSQIPSCAGLKYKSAFFRNDKKRYLDFLEKLKDNKVSVNASVLFPYQLVGKALYENESKELLNGMWNNLPDYIGENKEDCIAVIDTSGSMENMNRLPLNIAISLGLYLAEKNKGRFKNHFITFSERPELVEIVGDNFCDKVNNINNSNWGMNTDINKTFDLILNTAIKYDLPQEELPSRIIIISDMEFDCSWGWGYSPVKEPCFEKIKRDFKSHGYNMPKLVFWNVNSTHDNVPMTINDAGVQLVSGANPYIFDSLLKNEFVDAYDLMLKELSKEIYDCIRI